MQVTWIRWLLASRGGRSAPSRLRSRVHSGSMPRKLDAADRLTSRVEVGVTGGMKAAIDEAATRLSEDAGRRVSEGDVVRMLLARGLRAMAISIKRLPGPPPRPPRGQQRKPADEKKRKRRD